MNKFNVDVSSQSQSSSTHLPNSALRTRNRRLVNLLGEDSGDEATLHHETQCLSTYSSRAPSPIPSKHPSRSSSSRPSQQRGHTLGRNWTQNSTKSALQNDLTTQFNGLWGNSWSALQGLASTVLGSDASSETVTDNAAQRRRRPREATHSPVRGASGPSKWGPSAPASPRLGAGSQEERQAMVRAKKREELLLSNGSAYMDNAANYKRRNSDDFESMSAPPGESDLRDTLVYIHHVQPEDTLAGISIKFGCSLAVLKSANGIWTSDFIISRKTIVIPVNECSVKGRRVDSPLSTNLLVENDNTQSNSTDYWHHRHRRNSSSTIKAPSNPTIKSPSTLAITSPQPGTPAWTHDSWIQMANDHSAIEIARLPRRDLGFFPRARRKSTCPSDITTTTPTVTSPSPSDIIPRISLDKPPAATRSRPRAPSNTTPTHFAALMQGPGGVGRLVGRSPVRGPGPAEDKLNKLFAPHLPNVAPPPAMPPLESSLPSHAVLLGGGPSSPGARRSIDSSFSAGTGAGGGGGGGSNLEHVGGAIEGWMRKVAARAAQMVEPGSPLLSPHGPGGGGSGGAAAAMAAGDLIELSDAGEAADGEALGERRGGWDVWDAGLGDGRPAGGSGGGGGGGGGGWDRGRARLPGLERSGWGDETGSKTKGD